MEHQHPLVSVVIPAYNYADFLPETLQSIIGQTYAPIETIVVDDGSTDDTRAVVESFANHPITYLSQPNAGQAAARNYGIRTARGEFVAFCDADDVWLPHKLSTQMKVFFRNPAADIVYCDVFKFSAAGVWPKTLWQEKGIEPRRGGRECLAALCQRNFIPGAMTVVRRSAFERFGYYDESLRVCEEYSLWLHMITRGARIDYAYEPLARYRQHARQITANIGRIEAGNLCVIKQALALPETKPFLTPPLREKRLARIYGASAKRYLLHGKLASDIGKSAQAFWHLVAYFALTANSTRSKATARP